MPDLKGEVRNISEEGEQIASFLQANGLIVNDLAGVCVQRGKVFVRAFNGKAYGVSAAPVKTSISASSQSVGTRDLVIDVTGSPRFRAVSESMFQDTSSAGYYKQLVNGGTITGVDFTIPDTVKSEIQTHDTVQRRRGDPPNTQRNLEGDIVARYFRRLEPFLVEAGLLEEGAALVSMLPKPQVSTESK